VKMTSRLAAVAVGLLLVAGRRTARAFTSTDGCGTHSDAAIGGGADNNHAINGSGASSSAARTAAGDDGRGAISTGSRDGSATGGTRANNATPPCPAGSDRSRRRAATGRFGQSAAGSGSAASPGILPRAYGRHHWAAHPCRHPSLPAGHWSRADGVADSGSGHSAGLDPDNRGMGMCLHPPVSPLRRSRASL
jgi:hypothetical protein